MFSIICAVGKNNEIGVNNKLPWHIKKDFKFFKQMTLNHKIVMGATTYTTLPGKLPGRDIFVLSRTLVNNDVTVIQNAKKFIEENIDTEEEIFICGGASIYKLFLPYAKKIYLTEIEKSYDNADTFFPNFDKTKYTKIILNKENENNLNFSFVLYKKIN